VPKFLSHQGFRYFIYSNEGNEPPHVHVERDGNVAKFWLGPVRLERPDGMREADLQRAKLTIEEHEQEFRDKYAEHQRAAGRV
jgi:Domain of unknown function (DUF4160)